MEVGAFIGHGAANILRDRLLLSSDAYTCTICNKCGYITPKEMCLTCKSPEHIVEITIPYASKLLIQELAGVNISVKMHV